MKQQETENLDDYYAKLASDIFIEVGEKQPKKKNRSGGKKSFDNIETNTKLQEQKAAMSNNEP